MSEARPGLGPVLLTVMLDLVGFGLVIPLMSYYAESFDASPVQTTLLMASYSIAQFFCAPLWGSLSDRVGRRPVMLASIAGATVFLAAFASASALWQLYLFRTLHGACAANIGAAQAYVADVTTPENRARGMGLIGASFGVGFTLGPMIGGLLADRGLSAPIWFAAALSAINFVWTLARLPESRRPDSAPVHRRTLDPRQMVDALRHPVVGRVVFLGFCGTFAFSMMESTFGLVAEHVWSMRPRDVGMLFGGIGVVGIVIQGGLIGRLTRRFGEAPLLASGLLTTATGMTVLAVTRPGLLWPAGGTAAVVGGCALMAAGSSLTNPSTTALISRSTTAEEQGRVLGVNQSWAALARAVAPTVGGLLYARVFQGAAFVAGAALMLAALAVAARSLLALRPTTSHA